MAESVYTLVDNDLWLKKKKKNHKGIKGKLPAYVCVCVWYT